MVVLGFLHAYGSGWRDEYQKGNAKAGQEHGKEKPQVQKGAGRRNIPSRPLKKTARKILTANLTRYGARKPYLRDPNLSINLSPNSFVDGMRVNLIWTCAYGN